MNNKFFFSSLSYFIYASCLLLAAGCSEDSSPEPSDTNIPIGFKAERVIPTRAGTEQFADGTVLGVFAYRSGDDYTSIAQPDLLYNGSLTKTTTEGLVSYQNNPAVHWPTATGKVYFAAYYPHNSVVSEGAILLSSPVWPGKPEFTVELGIDEGKVDFAVAEVGPITPEYNPDNKYDNILRDTNYVNFHFTRQMSEVAFRAKTTNINPLTRLYINALSIKNIYKKGTYKMETKTWNTSGNVDGVTGATLKIASGGSSVSDTEFEYIMNPSVTSPREASVVMIPQKYENVELDVIYTIEYLKAEGGCEYRIVGTKKIPITVDWKAGYLYVYDIEFGFYEAEDEKTNLFFKVKEWIKKEIDTEID